MEFIQGWCQFQGMIFTDKMSGECPFYPHLNVIANVHGSVVPLRRGGISCFKWKSSRWEYQVFSGLIRWLNLNYSPHFPFALWLFTQIILYQCNPSILVVTLTHHLLLILYARSNRGFCWCQPDKRYVLSKISCLVIFKDLKTCMPSDLLFPQYSTMFCDK